MLLLVQRDRTVIARAINGRANKAAYQSRRSPAVFFRLLCIVSCCIIGFGIDIYRAYGIYFRFAAPMYEPLLTSLSRLYVGIWVLGFYDYLRYAHNPKP